MSGGLRWKTVPDASCLLVVSFNSTKRRVEYFIVSYVGYRFTVKLLFIEYATNAAQ